MHCDSLNTDKTMINPYDLKTNYCGEVIGLFLEAVCERYPGIGK